MCACPKIATIAEDMSKVCADTAGTIGCIASTPSCATIAKDMNEKEVSLMCEYTSKGCEENTEKMMTCAGDDMKLWDEKDCGGDLTGKEECCPIAKTLLECIGKDCNTISMALVQMKADAGSEEAKKEVEESEKARKACPDAGIPSAATVSATASEGQVTEGPDAATASFAAPGQTVSMLAMAAVISASLMA